MCIRDRIIVVREEIDIALDQLALTDKEDLHTHPALVHVVAKDIPVLQLSLIHI